MESDLTNSGLDATMKKLKVDGGASINKFLMQFQADICCADIVRPIVRETTALGAACLAGITVGFWKDLNEVKNNWQCDVVFKAQMDLSLRKKLITGWHKAVSRSRDWAE
jgi:glycerol kinase